MGRREETDAVHRLTYHAHRSWFYNQPKLHVDVRGSAAARTTAAAIREAGGHVIKVQERSGWWFW